MSTDPKLIALRERMAAKAKALRNAQAAQGSEAAISTDVILENAVVQNAVQNAPVQTTEQPAAQAQDPAAAMRERIAAKIAAAKLAAKASAQPTVAQPTAAQTTAVPNPELESALSAIADAAAKALPTVAQMHASQEPAQEFISKRAAVPLNPQQQEAVDLGLANKSFCLIGAAGTGKTTTVQELINTVLSNDPDVSIALVAFTNKAMHNIRRACTRIADPVIRSRALRSCMTIHKFLAYRPAKVGYIDEDGNNVEGKRFMPTYTAQNPRHVQLVVIDESSMVDLYLWRNLMRATPGTTYVFIGDLNQLPPVFGDAILGYKMLEIPVVELTQVYRQALESPIVRFQYEHTLPGKVPSQSTLEKYNADKNGVTFHALTKIYEPEVQSAVIAAFFRKEYEAGRYKPVDDIILIPFNKRFGTILLNANIAQWLGTKREAIVHEVIAGFQLKYFAQGDVVIYNKEEYIIDSIEPNTKYRGKDPRPASVELNRFGVYGSADINSAMPAQLTSSDFSLTELLDMAPDTEHSPDGEKVVRQASHKLMLRPYNLEPDDTFEPIEVFSAGEIAALDFAYATTIHKSQGSEWNKVYLIVTKHHAVMLSRELLYTGMTRAAKELYVIYSPQSRVGAKDSSIARCVANPVVPGQGWRQKVQYFATKQAEYDKLMEEDIDSQYWEL